MPNKYTYFLELLELCNMVVGICLVHDRFSVAWFIRNPTSSHSPRNIHWIIIIYLFIYFLISAKSRNHSFRWGIFHVYARAFPHSILDGWKIRWPGNRCSYWRRVFCLQMQYLMHMVLFEIKGPLWKIEQDLTVRKHVAEAEWCNMSSLQKYHY